MAHWVMSRTRMPSSTPVIGLLPRRWHRARNSTSSSERKTSLRCVHVDAPTNSARAHARSPAVVVPATRRALAAASGHSRYGSTRGVASTDRIVNVSGSISAARWYSCTIETVPARSMCVSRNIESTTSGSSGSTPRVTSMRRMRRIPLGAMSYATLVPGAVVSEVVECRRDGPLEHRRTADRLDRAT